MRRGITIGLLATGVVAALGALAPGAAHAADDGSCVDVQITNSVGRFDGWQCQDSSGTSVGGQLWDTRRDGTCVVLAVQFSDGLRKTRKACDGQRWPMWVGVASNHQGVSSISVVTT